MININKKYKDRLFRLVFGSRESLLELYNAVNNSHYKEAENLEITTLDDVVYMSMKNDVSFLVDDILNLYEHQSTYNPNMTIRGLFYLADVYRKYVENRKLNLYGSRLVKLPVPNYLVFYNGLKDEPDQLVLRLSDSFEHRRDADPCLELKAVMMNINLGHNQEIMERCDKLLQYSQFVQRVRTELSLEPDFKAAIDRAVTSCIQDGILAEILSAHRAEVLDVILTDYNEQEHIAMERAEAEEKGFEKGLALGKMEGLAAGKAEGLAAGKAESVLELLSDLGEIPVPLKEQIKQETCPCVLGSWVRLAAKAVSIEDFIEKYKKI